LHGGGAAHFAYNHCGASWGIGQGFTRIDIENAGSYALPTKYHPGETMKWDEVYGAVKVFLAYARTAKDKTFFVTRVGCGLAGFTDSDIYWMFMNAPDNCILPPEWKDLLEDEDAEETAE
jgi:hypothetical protein